MNDYLLIFLTITLKCFLKETDNYNLRRESEHSKILIKSKLEKILFNS